jgi:tRNA threonylcarbamoyladenosine biosynthesis protein TsaE
VNTAVAEIRSRSEAETLQIGKLLARHLKPGMTVALQGTLGSGKTVLARGIARGLGVEEPVTSPTFTMVQEYSCKDSSWLYHIDLYRIDTEEQALAFGIAEYLFPPDGVCLVEWMERIPQLLKTGSRENSGALVCITVDHAGANERVLRLPAAIAGKIAGDPLLYEL